jgi:hypothetical protein
MSTHELVFYFRCHLCGVVFEDQEVMGCGE